ncbi:protein FRA10AC1 [Anabrus simplex]|uniref:protein FRA10AC1 n=1 Tax=Anabrus simplex TaxID=316456 RepID=UPI0035A3AD6C
MAGFNVADLWRLEAIGISDPADIKTKELEAETLEFFEKTVKVDQEGRYELCLPWKEGHPQLRDNYDLAEKRLLSASKRLETIGKLQEQYKQPSEADGAGSGQVGRGNAAVLNDRMSASGSLRAKLSSLSAYDAHKLLINEYILWRRGATAKLQRDTSRDKHDIDVIRDNHRFLWDEDDTPRTWEERLAKKYYDKLFKEYCVCDLRKYKENKVAMRWRTEKEVVTGKGQFSCASNQCSEADGLSTWEVNFGYIEKGEKKNALVKLRLCPECSDKLNYSHKKREVIRGKRKSSSKSEADAEVHRKLKKTDTDESNSAEEKIVNIKEEPSEEQDEGKVWRKVGQDAEEKTREEEFEEYLEDLFL